MDGRWILVCGSMAGFAMGIKYTSFILPVAIVLCLVWWLLKQSFYLAFWRDLQECLFWQASPGIFVIGSGLVIQYIHLFLAECIGIPFGPTGIATLELGSDGISHGSSHFH